jgi:hypothetical protein
MLYVDATTSSTSSIGCTADFQSLLNLLLLCLTQLLDVLSRHSPRIKAR